MSLWTYFVDHLKGIAFVASIAVAVCGLVALLLVCLLWGRVVPYYREFWAKLAVAFFRFVATAAGLTAKSAVVPPGTPLENQPWVPTALIAIAGYLLWEFVGAIGDHKYKLAKEKSADQYKDEITAANKAKDAAEEQHLQEIDALTQDKDDAVEQFLRLGRMVSHLRMLVAEKHQRIRRTLRASTTTRGSLPATRTALAPVEQIGMILEKLASLLHFDAAADRHDQNFRVGLYAEEKGHLVPIDAFDFNTRRHDPFTSYLQHTEWFRLDNTVNPSHAVRCVRDGRTLIVPDCANHPGFLFFHDRQRHYLKSLVAYPLFDFSSAEDGSSPRRLTTMAARYLGKKPKNEPNARGEDRSWCSGKAVSALRPEVATTSANRPLQELPERAFTHGASTGEFQGSVATKNWCGPNGMVSWRVRFFSERRKGSRDD